MEEITQNNAKLNIVPKWKAIHGTRQLRLRKVFMYSLNCKIAIITKLVRVRAYCFLRRKKLLSSLVDENQIEELYITLGFQRPL